MPHKSVSAGHKALSQLHGKLFGGVLSPSPLASTTLNSDLPSGLTAFPVLPAASLNCVLSCLSHSTAVNKSQMYNHPLKHTPINFPTSLAFRYFQPCNHKGTREAASELKPLSMCLKNKLHCLLLIPSISSRCSPMVWLFVPVFFQEPKLS